MSADEEFKVVPPLAPGIGDPHGQAALTLVESLIHGLVARQVLTTPDAVEIVDVAADSQADLAEDADGGGERVWQSHTLLTTIGESLAHDLPAVRGV